MTETKHNHETDCLMCAVRALTEGDPAATWSPTEAGQTISGVVLRMGTLTTDFGLIPFVDLWQGGTDRVRVKAYNGTLRHALDGAAAQIGDRLQIWFDGVKVIQNGRRVGQKRWEFSANVQRGH